jgi:2-oxoacid:acceptor oxidoreductase gamma subunit (pyruvate/2-ketoisovalerate family)
MTAPRESQGVQMRELRIHGRGGQGAVIASKLLADALFREGHQVQSFPAFGVERRGAPVTAFLRVSDSPIRLRCEITEPDDLIVLDPTLIDAVDITSGMKPGGTILINSKKDASAIAIRHGLGSPTQPIVNTALMGAFAAEFGMVTLDSVCGAIEDAVPLKIEENLEAAKEAAETVRSAERGEAIHV